MATTLWIKPTYYTLPILKKDFLSIKNLRIYTVFHKNDLGSFPGKVVDYPLFS